MPEQGRLFGDEYWGNNMSAEGKYLFLHVAVALGKI